MGEKSPRRGLVFGSAQVKIAGPDITVTGSNSEDVGQTCRNLINAVKIKGKDIRVFQDGIYYVE
ncbi:50S ribosomal protein L6 [uncultured archaeon]|nr:50S ribosomal protein L6 [uncultured archaeon]